jgi:CCR4-NOT transcription complex subunit 2
MQIWLTKDELMVPQSLGPTLERGYYIVWDTAVWHKERVSNFPQRRHRCSRSFVADILQRELTLHYADLDGSTNLSAMSQLVGISGPTA